MVFQYITRSAHRDLRTEDWWRIAPYSTSYDITLFENLAKAIFEANQNFSNPQIINIPWQEQYSLSLSALKIINSYVAELIQLNQLVTAIVSSDTIDKASENYSNAIITHCIPRNYNQQTPFFIAILTGHLQWADYLIHHGANINAVDAFGDSPLVALLKSNKSHIPKTLLWLLHHGAHYDIESITWKSYLQSANINQLEELSSNKVLRDHPVFLIAIAKRVDLTPTLGMLMLLVSSSNRKLRNIFLQNHGQQVSVSNLESLPESIAVLTTYLQEIHNVAVSFNNSHSIELVQQKLQRYKNQIETIWQQAILDQNTSKFISICLLYGFPNRANSLFNTIFNDKSVAIANAAKARQAELQQQAEAMLTAGTIKINELLPVSFDSIISLRKLDQYSQHLRQEYSNKIQTDQQLIKAHQILGLPHSTHEIVKQAISKFNQQVDEQVLIAKHNFTIPGLPHSTHEIIKQAISKFNQQMVFQYITRSAHRDLRTEDWWRIAPYSTSYDITLFENLAKAIFEANQNFSNPQIINIPWQEQYSLSLSALKIINSYVAELIQLNQLVTAIVSSDTIDKASENYSNAIITHCIPRNYNQ